MIVLFVKPWFNAAMTLNEALVYFGSVRQIAEALGVSVQAVYAWGDTVPDLRAYQLREMIEMIKKLSARAHSEHGSA